MKHNDNSSDVFKNLESAFHRLAEFKIPPIYTFQYFELIVLLMEMYEELEKANTKEEKLKIAEKIIRRIEFEENTGLLKQ